MNRRWHDERSAHLLVLSLLSLAQSLFLPELPSACHDGWVAFVLSQLILRKCAEVYVVARKVKQFSTVAGLFIVYVRPGGCFLFLLGYTSILLQPLVKQPLDSSSRSALASYAAAPQEAVYA